MRRRSCLATLIAAIPAAVAGCMPDPSPLSPLASENPELHARATREMTDVARRNREAEAAFHRRHAAARAVGSPEAASDPNVTVPPQPKQHP